MKADVLRVLELVQIPLEQVSGLVGVELAVGKGEPQGRPLLCQFIGDVVVGHLGEVVNVQTQNKLLRSEAVTYQPSAAISFF